MTHLVPLLALAAATMPLSGPSSAPDYLPSALKPVTASGFLVQAQTEASAALCRVRYTGSTENDLAVLRNGNLGLLIRPGRLECFYTIKSTVAGMTAISLTGSAQESLMVASDDGLERLGFDPTTMDLHSPTTSDTISTSPLWGQTRGLWVHDEGGGAFGVYGAVGTELLAAHYDTTNGWVDLGALPLGVDLQELAWFDYDGDGQDEIAWRLPNALLVQETTNNTFLVNLPATADDRIVTLRDAGLHDRLAWSTKDSFGDDVLTLFEFNAMTPWVDIDDGRPTALLPMHYSDSANGQEVIAVSSSQGYALVQATSGQNGPATPVPLPDGIAACDTADMRDDPTGSGVGIGSVAAATGDFDGDGRDDLAFLRSDGELLFWLGHVDRVEHSYVCLGVDNPEPDDSTGDLLLPLSMRRGDDLAVGGESYVRVWFRGPGNVGIGTFAWSGIVSEIPDPNGSSALGDVIMPIDMGSTPYTVGDTVRVSITPRVMNGGVLERYAVTRNLLWEPNAPSGTGWPEINVEPAFAHLNTTGGGEGDGTGTRTGGGANEPPTTPPPGG